MYRKKLLVFSLCAGLGSLFIFLSLTSTKKPMPIDPPSQPHESTPPPPPASFNKQLFSIDNPDSQWVVINKSRPLPQGYQPSQLVVPGVRLRLDKTAEQMQTSNVMAEPLVQLFEVATRADINLVLSSGFRSDRLQKTFYNGYVAKDGMAAADRYSARPGYSEHQTGLAVDVGGEHGCLLEICFGQTPEGKWLAANATAYGFIIRYPSPDKEQSTGYQYEPWHLRYVGLGLAQELTKTGQTMEEFFSLPNPSYQN